MEAHYAYTAGFVEADGCFHITNSGAGIRVTNKCVSVLQFFKQNFGGSIKSKSTPANCFEWDLYGNSAVNLIQNLLPYLLIKKEEAEILLEFSKTMGPRGKRVSEEVKNKRDELRLKLVEQRKIRNGS
jgi:hypothetical protein